MDVLCVVRFSMIFEPGYEPPSKKSCPSPRPGSSLEPAPLDCSKTESNGADLRIRQVGAQSEALRQISPNKRCSLVYRKKYLKSNDAKISV